MEPVLAQALSTLIGAIASAILMAAAYYWGPRRDGEPSRSSRRRQRREDRYDERETSDD